MSDSVKALVVVPAYNEESTIGDVVGGVIELGFAVCVIDDGSNDATAEVAEHAGAAVLVHGTRLGRGRALRSGFSYALSNGHAVAVAVDGDGQHDVRDVPTLVAYLEETDVDFVVGSRFTHADGPYQIDHFRRLAMHLVTQRVSSVAGADVTDATSGFCAARRPLLDYFADTYPTDFLAETAGVLAHTYVAGWRVAEIPIRMAPRRVGRSKTGLLKTLWCLAAVLTRVERLRWRRTTQHHPVRPKTAASPVPSSSAI